MIDKIVMQINEDDIKQIAGGLAILHSDQFKKAEYKNSNYLGDYKCFKVYKRGQGFQISGSLANFALESNCFNGDQKSISQAVKKLVDETGIPISTRITHLEFGFNIPVIRPTSAYLRLMKSAVGYIETFTHKNKEVVFLQTEKKLRFYNKSSDFNGNKNQVRLLHKMNVLRYEVVIMYPKRILGLEHRLTLAHLVKKSIYADLLNLWLGQFYRVVLDKKFRHDFELKNVNDLRRHLVTLGIEHYGGIAAMLQLVDTISFSEYPNVNKSRAKGYLQKIYRDTELFEKSDLIEELRQKIIFTALCHSS